MGRIILLLSEVKLQAHWDMALGVSHAVLGTFSLRLMHLMLVPTRQVSFLTDLFAPFISKLQFPNTSKIDGRKKNLDIQTNLNMNS